MRRKTWKPCGQSGVAAPMQYFHQDSVLKNQFRAVHLLEETSLATFEVFNLSAIIFERFIQKPRIPYGKNNKQ
jgi:hypothetical protein